MHIGRRKAAVIAGELGSIPAKDPLFDVNVVRFHHTVEWASFPRLIAIQPMEIIPNGLLIHVGHQASAASRIAHVKFLVILPPKPSPGAEAPEPPWPHLSLYRPLVGRETGPAGKDLSALIMVLRDSVNPPTER